MNIDNIVYAYVYIYIMCMCVIDWGTFIIIF